MEKNQKAKINIRRRAALDPESYHVILALDDLPILRFPNDPPKGVILELNLAARSVGVCPPPDAVIAEMGDRNDDQGPPFIEILNRCGSSVKIRGFRENPWFQPLSHWPKR